VVVIAPGGNQADGLSFTMHAAQQGFLEVRLCLSRRWQGEIFFWWNL